MENNNKNEKNVFELLFGDMLLGLKEVLQYIYALLVIMTCVFALSQCCSYMSDIGNTPLVKAQYKTAPAYDDYEYNYNKNW